MTVEILGILYYNVHDTAEMLMVSEHTIRDWCRKGKIKFRKIGRDIYIAESEIKEFLKPKGE